MLKIILLLLMAEPESAPKTELSPAAKFTLSESIRGVQEAKAAYYEKIIQAEQTIRMFLISEGFEKCTGVDNNLKPICPAEKKEAKDAPKN